MLHPIVDSQIFIAYVCLICCVHLWLRVVISCFTSILWS